MSSEKTCNINKLNDMKNLRFNRMFFLYDNFFVSLLIAETLFLPSRLSKVLTKTLSSAFNHKFSSVCSLRLCRGDDMNFHQWYRFIGTLSLCGRYHWKTEKNVVHNEGVRRPIRQLFQWIYIDRNIIKINDFKWDPICILIIFFWERRNYLVSLLLNHLSTFLEVW